MDNPKMFSRICTDLLIPLLRTRFDTLAVPEEAQTGSAASKVDYWKVEEGCFLRWNSLLLFLHWLETAENCILLLVLSNTTHGVDQTSWFEWSLLLSINQILLTLTETCLHSAISMTSSHLTYSYPWKPILSCTSSNRTMHTLMLPCSLQFPGRKWCPGDGMDSIISRQEPHRTFVGHSKEEGCGHEAKTTRGSCGNHEGRVGADPTEENLHTHQKFVPRVQWVYWSKRGIYLSLKYSFSSAFP